MTNGEKREKPIDLIKNILLFQKLIRNIYGMEISKDMIA